MIVNSAFVGQTAGKIYTGLNEDGLKQFLFREVS